MEQQLFNSYGDNELSNADTNIQFENQLYAQNTTTMFIQFRIFNKHKLPISNFRPDYIKEEIKIMLNEKQLPGLLPTTRVGQFKILITPQQKNILQIYMSENLIFEQTYIAKMTFQPNPDVRIRNLTCVAINTTLVKLHSIFTKSRGNVIFKFSAPTLCGYFYKNQTYLIQVEGQVNITGTGDKLIFKFQGEQKELANLQNNDIEICFKLKTGKTCELVAVSVPEKKQ